MSSFAGKTFLFMAGGTGGHVYPALTIADALAAQGATIHWLGNRDGFEGRAVADAGYTLHDINVRGLRGNGAIGWLKAPLMVSKAILRARSIIKQLRPALVVGMGGFAAGPGGVAAKLCGVPLVIHEQNAVMGLTNKLLARIASTILLADPRAAAALSKQHYEVVGNPVRNEMFACSLPEVRYGSRNGPIRLLVLGGSQGAKAINEAVPHALAHFNEQQRPLVRHQVGPRWVDAVRGEYLDLGIEAEVTPFISDMADALATCDWVLCRSGALTVAELAAVGVPAVCVPLPQAVDDHQTANAQVLLDAGAATILPQCEMNTEKLVEIMRNHQDRGALLAQAKAAKTCAKPDAVTNIVAIMERFV